MQKYIPIAEAKEGMMLAKSITDDQGRTLCAEGTTLNERLINRFNQMGIASICIESEEVMSEEEYIKLKQTIAERFKVASDPSSLLGKIKTVIMERLQAKKGS
jgi:hypothetical protein